jgi:hypothetical protein
MAALCAMDKIKILPLSSLEAWHCPSSLYSVRRLSRLPLAAGMAHLELLGGGGEGEFAYPRAPVAEWNDAQPQPGPRVPSEFQQPGPKKHLEAFFWQLEAAVPW